MQFDPTKRPEGFDTPTALPAGTEQSAKWQEANRRFWENNPMSYDWREDTTARELTSEFFEDIDTRFLSSVRHFMPWKKHAFEALVPFDRLSGMDVLEIGVGLGTHAQLIAPHTRSYTGIDLTDRAAGATSRRMQLRGINARILRMDAEEMSFPDNSFDFVWSWGVIHHSSNTRRIVEQIHRVLRPGGRATIMVYNRSFFTTWIIGGLIRGVVMGDFLRGRGLHEIVQNLTDGAIARYYTPRDFQSLVGDLFQVDRFRVYGMKEEFVPLPRGRIKDAILRATPDALSRLAMNSMRQGSMLVAEMISRKPAGTLPSAHVAAEVKPYADRMTPASSPSLSGRTGG